MKRPGIQRSIHFSIPVVASLGLLLPLATGSARGAGEAPTTTGPDVTIIYLTGPGNYGQSGGIRGFSLGTTSCNIGSKPVNWCNDGGSSGCGADTTAADHPVIAQNLYRLRAGRFEQIGMSWLKHGFLSTNSPDAACGACVVPPLGGDQLGVGCTDAYGSGLNGSRPLGMRSEVNATTGVFPYPYTQVSPGVVWEQRIKVFETDLDPVPSDDRYWMEGQYIASDDAKEGNGLNNASYREVQFANDGIFSPSFVGGTIREKSALYGWQAVDAAVEIAHVDALSPGRGTIERFEVARRVTELPPFVEGGGTWHYEYVVRNMNSDRAARAFRVDLAGAFISGVGFHDIDHHSGEPYATTDWTASVDPAGAVEWSTDTFTTDPDANALRWGTAFSFWFDADRPPAEAIQRLDFFKPACPGAAYFTIPDAVVFGDGFECGGVGAWSGTAP